MLVDAIKEFYKESEAGGDVTYMVPKLLDEILATKNAEELRGVIPDFHDWIIPTRIQFVMHVQLLRSGCSSTKDVLAFADFLDAFYEDMSEWAAALRRSASAL